MRGHCSSERSAKTSNSSFDTNFFNKKFKNCLAIMNSIVRIRCALRSCVASVVPDEHVYSEIKVKLHPKAVWSVYLLLIALSIWTEVDHSVSLKKLSFYFLIFLPFLDCAHFVICVRKEHAIEHQPVERLN